MLIGGLSFLIGFVGPALISDSNLDPMLGIFVTGPLGFLLGALIGTLISAGRKARRLATAEVQWLGGAWIGAILFTLAASIGSIGWLSVGAQVSVIISTAILFYFIPVQLPEPIRKSRSIILGGAAAVLATSILPPVKSASSGSPVLALFLDEKFDASTRVPEYTVDQTKLLAAWLIIAAAVIVVAVVRGGSVRSRRP